MRRRGVILLLVIILFSFPIIFSEDTEVSPIVLQNIEDNDVNVIVQLEQPIEDLTQKEKLQSADVELEQLTDNFYRATINEQELQELIQDPNVQSINNDEVFHILLTGSVPLINASFVHTLQSNSINLTGRAQTICIIDTGVNSTHPGLAGRVIAQKCFCSISDYGAGGCCPDTTIESNTATDDQGHGTHVSGIAASNGSSIIGVAPEANIVAVKVADSSGSALFSDILLGVSWCNDNANLYNITVISMSLGGGSFTSACDDSYTSLSTEIAEAWNKNITVTVATGNSGSTTIMTSPACINKTISVSATTKTDVISSISNRNSLTDLFAPGESITSLNYIGTTAVKTGTSMAAPHVAGVIALLQQYKQEVEGRPLTAQEINDTLATNGTLINDLAGSGRNFIRIDAYKALSAIDNFYPQLTDSNTTSTTIYIYNNITFLANATDVTLKSVLLESNHTGSLVNYSITNVNSNQYNYTLANNTFSSGVFQWRILVNDSHGNINASNWYNLTIYTGAPIITLSYPTDNLLTNNNSITINFTATDDADPTFNCTLYSDSILNQTKNISNGTVSEFKVNYTEGTHNWNILCNDSHLLTSNSSLITINLDLTKPYFLSESHPTTEIGDNITFSVVANDTYLRYVNFSYDRVNYSLTNTSTTFSKTFTTYQYGTNNFATYTADYAGNINASTNSFNIQDTITGPRIVNFKYSSSVVYNANQYITLFIVDSRDISSARLSYSGTNYSLSNNTYYNYTYSFTASACGTNTFKIFTNDTLNNGVTNTTTFSVTGCCGDGACSSSETCTSCLADCGACSTTGSTGGGGGGGTTPITTTLTNDNITAAPITHAPEITTTQEPISKTSTIIEEASPDNPISVNLEDTLTNILISVNENVSNIEINVKQINSLPSSIPIPKELVFKYFELKVNNLNYTSMTNANISFQVPKSWVSENSFEPNSIKLQRYESTWEPLRTTLNSEDNESYYYTSSTPGFSYFAITGEKTKEYTTNWILISIIAVFLFIALILFLVHELKQNED